MSPDGPCPICEREHPPTEFLSDGGLTTIGNTTATGENPNTAGVDGVRPARRRRSFTPQLRCPLPDRVLKSQVLIVDNNLISLKIMQKYFEKFGLHPDTTTNSEEALEAYRKDPMKYNVIVVDSIQPQPVTGIDVFLQIREFERTNTVPPCFLIASDNARSMLINRDGLREKVLDSGVDLMLPWYRYQMPLYDALARLKERGQWLERPGTLGIASVVEDERERRGRDLSSRQDL